jgi:hypothetical protein
VNENVTAHLDTGAPLEYTAEKIAQCSGIGDLEILNEDWTFDGDFFRIQSAALTYQLPDDWLPKPFTGITAQFRVTNLALFADYPTGMDPDALVGAAINELDRFGGLTVPPPRTYSLNLRFNF